MLNCTGAWLCIARFKTLICISLVAWGGSFVTAAAGDAASDVPAFIRMYGEWESVAVKAEPISVFDAMPALNVLHEITGTQMDVGPGIRFKVVQTVEDEAFVTEIAYVYDAASKKSFGVFLNSAGATVRGVIEHGEESDLLHLYDANDAIIWTERKIWTSPDVFESAAVFPYEGGEAKVWFETRRKTVSESE